MTREFIARLQTRLGWRGLELDVPSCRTGVAQQRDQEQKVTGQE